MKLLARAWRARPLGRLTVTDWAWLHFKVAMLVWAVALWRFTPLKVGDALGGLTVSVAVVTIIGALVSVIGLIIAAQSRRVAITGLTVELSGLALLAAGPVAYFATQVYLAVTLVDGEQRYALCVLAYVLCAALAARIIIVRRRRRRTVTGV